MASKTLPYSVDKSPECYDEYKFTLPELFRDLAKEELHEDATVREEALTQMRQWIVDNPYIRKCRTDAQFLLRFLRFRKYSVPKACEALERYLAMRETYPKWFKKLDVNEPATREMLEDGVFANLGQDANGRTVVYFRFGYFNVDKFGPLQEARLAALLIESLMEWEEVQIGGFRVLVDFSDSVMKHYGIWGVSDMKILMDAINRSYPIRFHEIHGAKFPKFAIPILNLMLSFASPKMKESIICHNSVEDMAKQFDESLLPKECGGKRDLRELTQDLLKHLEDSRDVILALDDMEIDTAHYVSLWQDSYAPHIEIEASIMENFRNLTVD
ncbi:retinaldehyde-binding protein 1-like [Anopheles nili]|uniref:retinaldehyde-binding protein 1-like n=1 Tax=Anopheles nili TaxID=185578 RepID=UPI00237C19D0|nr:retinaldehyde-binding protein 1-like [Anopheles nili]